MVRLAGKIAVVTGASRGIGAAIARRLAKDGALVVVNYASNAQAAEKLVGEIVAAGGKASAVQADVADPKQVRRLFNTVQQRHERVDILVNNAGIALGGPLAEFAPEEYHKLFDINVGGPLQVSNQALPLFPASGGRIINVTSLVARFPIAGFGVYSATKAALESLTRVWAVELGPRQITVNAVAPGLIATDMGNSVPEEMRAALVAQTPLGRAGQPQDIADVVAFLASDDARWVSGQSITAAGGTPD